MKLLILPRDSGNDFCCFLFLGYTTWIQLRSFDQRRDSTDGIEAALYLTDPGSKAEAQKAHGS